MSGQRYTDAELRKLAYCSAGFGSGMFIAGAATWLGAPSWIFVAVAAFYFVLSAVTLACLRRVEQP